MNQCLVLAALLVLQCVWYARLRTQAAARLREQVRHAGEEYVELVRRNELLHKDGETLSRALASTTALYDITKEISKHLEEEKLISVFQRLVNEHLVGCECVYREGKSETARDEGLTVLPLVMEGLRVGSVAARLTNDAERDRFHIVGNQFLLALRRSLLYQRLQEMAITDSLTGMMSRRYFMERFQEELERSRQLRYSFSTLMVDIDHFKEHNDRYGHLVGDVLLRESARLMKETLRQIDLVGRYGGEEFCVILTETDRDGALLAAERIRHAIEGKTIRAYDEAIKLTLSIGIAIFPFHGDDTRALLERSDAALYMAKRTGRNRVCVYEHEKR